MVELIFVQDKTKMRSVIQFVWKPEFDLPEPIRIDDGEDDDDEAGDPEPRCPVLIPRNPGNDER